MAAPSYTEDLTDINLAEVNTNWTDINFAGGGGGANAAGADFALQGTNCVDRPVSNNERGIMYNNGSTIAGTVAAGVHIYQWLFVATPGVTDTIANRGAYLISGTGTGALVQFHVEGNDTYGAAGRTGRCYPYRYNNTANTGSSPYRTLTGSPGATPQYFGAGIKTTATVKGSNVGVDAVRYGTGAYLTAGELISAGDGSDNPCTFAGFQAQNDAIANRWGIFTLVSGSYELQGKFAIGRNNAGTATLCRFQDSDRNITIPENPHVLSTFNEFIIDHASTVCNWTNINITSLGTTSRGDITVVNSATDFNVVGGTWTDIGAISLQAASSIDGATLRRTGTVTLNGGSISNCLIDSCRTASSIVGDGDLVDNCEFISDGSNHALEITAAGDNVIAWNSTTTGYVAGTAGNNVSSSSTGNETIYLNFTSSATFTINVGSGATVPSIRKGAGMTGAVNVIAGAVTVEITAAQTDGTPISGARVLVEAGATGNLPSNDSVTITRSGSTATVTHTAHGLENGDQVVIRGADQNEYVGIKTISNVTTNTYDFTVSGTPTTPATGTITSTFVFINGTTNGSGFISSTARTLTANQSVTGKVRKATSAPYFKTGQVVGTATTAAGLATTVILILDQ